MKIIHSIVFLIVLTGLLRSAPKTAEIQQALDTKILAEGLPLEQVRLFTESRVPEVPEFNDPDEWQVYSGRLRQQLLDNIVFRGNLAKYWRSTPSKIEWDEVIEDLPEYRIKKFRFEILPGWFCPALLYEPKNLNNDQKLPVVINVNGHDPKGKAAPYKQIRCIHQARNGMIAVNVEWIGMGQFHNRMSHYKLAQLDLCGVSGLAPFYLNVSRALDAALTHPNADPERVAVAGLSGGGWQTIFFSALDTRVKLANPVAGYSSFKTRARHTSDLGDSEQTPNDLATLADYTHLTALLADRALLLTKNAKDKCCFAAPHSLPPLKEAAEPKFKLLNREKYFRTHINYDPGTHNFEADNRRQLYKMLGYVFYGDQDTIPHEEKHTEAEIHSAEKLNVPLPENNIDLSTIAEYLADSLPIPVPGSDPLAGVERHACIPTLHKILQTTRYEVTAQQLKAQNFKNFSVTPWRLQLGKAWTIPAIEFSPKPKTDETVILLGDEGRSKLATQIQGHLSEGRAVMAIDPFYFGESKISTHDFLYSILVAAVGERPLGIQTSQVAAIARWTHERTKKPVDLEAHGMRTSAIALMSTTLEIKNIRKAELHGSLRSFKSLIKEGYGANKYPELFCFGLLEYFDVPELMKLATVAGKQRIFFK